MCDFNYRGAEAQSSAIGLEAFVLEIRRAEDIVHARRDAGELRIGSPVLGRAVMTTGLPDNVIDLAAARRAISRRSHD
jgi:hypothetical protein